MAKLRPQVLQPLSIVTARAIRARAAFKLANAAARRRHPDELLAFLTLLAELRLLLVMAMLHLFLIFTLEAEELTQAALLIILQEDGQPVAELVLAVLTVRRREFSLVVTEDRVLRVQVVEALLWQSAHREHSEERVGALLVA